MISEDTHPSELNILQQHRHAVKIAKSTSRLSNKDWYHDALDLDIQVHCYIKDDTGAACYLHVVSKKLYEPIGMLTAAQLEKYDELEKFINDVLSIDVCKKAKSLAVVLYLADEMSLASLGPEHQNIDELDELKALMQLSPKEALEDKSVSIESHGWRLFPYQGAPVGSESVTGVAVSRRYDNTLKILREIAEEINFPIRTAAICAPLCALASQPLFCSVHGAGTVTVINYQKFTLLGFFDPAYELMLVRYMPHPVGAKVPANIGPAVLATTTALELENPLIQLLPVSGQDIDPAIVSLQSSMMASEIVLVDINEILKKEQIQVPIPLEILVATHQLDPDIHPLMSNRTFQSHQEGRWPYQDFLSPSSSELAMTPGKEDIKLIKLSRSLKALATLAVLVCLLFTGFKIWTKISDPAWSNAGSELQGTQKALAEKVKKYDHLSSLFKGRSKAWATMELVMRTIPEDGSIVLAEVKHDVAPIAGGKKPKTLGFKKEWVISGVSNEKGLEYLSNISTREGIKKIFIEVANVTQNSAFLTDVGKREINVDLTQNDSSRIKIGGTNNPGRSLPYSFTLTITQIFDAEDDMAIVVGESKSKSKKK